MDRLLVLGVLLAAVAACPARPVTAPVPIEPSFVDAGGSLIEHDIDGGGSHGGPRGADGGKPVSPSVEALPPAKRATLRLAPSHGSTTYLERMKLGDEAFEQAKVTLAREHYAHAARLAPSDVAAKVGVIRCDVALTLLPLDLGAGRGDRRLAAARDALVAATRSDSRFGPAYAELGRVLLLMGEGEVALSNLTRAAQLLPGEAEPETSLALALLSLGRKEDALAAFARAVELDPGSGPRRGHLGTAYLLVGRVDEAIAQYEMQVRASPSSAAAYSDLGTAWLAKGEPQKSMPFLERAMALAPERATFRSNYGYALSLLGRNDDAIASYRLAIKQDPKLVSAWINLATILGRDDKTRAEARRCLATARGLDSTDPRIAAIAEELDELEKKKR